MINSLMSRSLAIRTAVVISIAIGCGPSGVSKSPSEQPAAADTAKEARPKAIPDSGNGANADEAAGSQTPRVVLDAWGDFPKDVFFEDPFAELGNGKPTQPGPSSNAAPSAAEQVAKDADIVTPPAADAGEAPANQRATHDAASVVWADLIPAEDLLTETNELRLRLAAELGSLAEYNANYRAIRTDAGVLAVLAGIAAQHEGAIPWKAEATRIRDAAAELGASVKGLGDQPYRAAQTAYTKVRDLMDGKATNDQRSPSPIIDMPWSNVADRSALMRRMKLAQDERIKALTSNEGEFRKNSARIVREAALVAALAQVASTSYDFCDDEMYQTYIRRLRDQSRQLSQAAREFDFAGAGKLTTANLKTCNDCHAEFRFGEIGF